MLRKKFYKSILISIVVAIGVLILSAGWAWVNYPNYFDNGIKATIKVKKIYESPVSRSPARYVYSDTMRFSYPEKIKFKQGDTIDIIYLWDTYQYIIIDARSEDTVYLSKDKYAKDIIGECIFIILFGLLIESVVVLVAVVKIRAKWRDYRYCRIKVDKIEVARFISDYDYVVEKVFIQPTTELQQEFAERVSKINYTLKKIDTEGGQDKFILVFYNKGKYDVLVDRYVDFKIYDDDYSLVHYRIFTQKKKFRLLIEELLGKSMY